MKKKIKDLILIISAIIANIILLVYTDYQCPWKNLGIECAGCGTTRMFKAIFRLDLYQAFRYNPMVFILLIIVIIYIIYILACIMFKKKYILPSTKALIALIVIVLIFMILRNTDMFSFLKPTEIN